ncbi:molybdenum cofactor guanylyltransferase MobA [Halomonas halocynthiae]|uniref:molybdenum cofactor guanylyltransferase MobA n=1 Tax=Halomonas halocynthiae TaxID=176290 RepID=UPI0004062E71|nr:molybdenum cofactor guanylyltransferase MobA [Halomonas halocynthiae]
MQQDSVSRLALGLDSPQAVTGLVLAGGRGQRLGGKDKGLVNLNGWPMVSYAMAVLSGHVAEVLISANRNLTEYDALGGRVVRDAEPGYPGPLAGLLAGLEAAHTPWLAVVPCDTPLLPHSLLPRLATTIGDADIAVAHDGERLHPVIALMRTALADDLGQYLASGRHKVRDWHQRHRCVTVDFSDCYDAFANLNAEQDHTRINAQLNAVSAKKHQ